MSFVFPTSISLSPNIPLAFPQMPWPFFPLIKMPKIIELPGNVPRAIEAYSHKTIGSIRLSTIILYRYSITNPAIIMFSRTALLWSPWSSRPIVPQYRQAEVCGKERGTVWYTFLASLSSLSSRSNWAWAAQWSMESCATETKHLDSLRELWSHHSLTGTICTLLLPFHSHISGTFHYDSFLIW